jgi:hypothetical protein
MKGPLIEDRLLSTFWKRNESFTICRVFNLQQALSQIYAQL